jgi:hypothetical protein
MSRKPIFKRLCVQAQAKSLCSFGSLVRGKNGTGRPSRKRGVKQVAFQLTAISSTLAFRGALGD